MNVFMLITLICFLWFCRIKSSVPPWKDLAILIGEDRVKLVVEPNEFFIESNPVNFWPASIYRQILKESILKGLNLTPALASLQEILIKIQELEYQSQNYWKTILSKVGFQVMLLGVVRFLLGSLWSINLLDGILSGIAALLVSLLFYCLYKKLPRPWFYQDQGLQSMFSAFLTYGQSEPEWCEGLNQLMATERRTGIGRQAEKLFLLQQKTNRICRVELERLQRLSDSMVLIEMTVALMLFSGLLMVPLSDYFLYVS